MSNLSDRLKICYDGDIIFKTKNDWESFYVLLEVPILYQD
jgi:hypothetical protein